MPLVGGVLALDFCNTSSGRGTDGQLEHLDSPGNLLTWARHAAVLDESKEARLRRIFDDNATAGERLLRRALDLREAVYNLQTALARGASGAQDDLDVVAATHAACIGKGRLAYLDGQFGWTWTLEEAPEETIIGPIVASAMALITTADRGRLKQCDGHHCGWLFLDTTKSNNRRWCEMDPCGNRAKQKRRRGRTLSNA